MGTNESGVKPRARNAAEDYLPEVRHTALGIQANLVKEVKAAHGHLQTLDAHIAKLEAQEAKLRARLDKGMVGDKPPDATFRALHKKLKQVELQITDAAGARQRLNNGLGLAMRPYRQATPDQLPTTGATE